MLRLMPFLMCILMRSARMEQNLTGLTATFHFIIFISLTFIVILFTVEIAVEHYSLRGGYVFNV